MPDFSRPAVPKIKIYDLNGEGHFVDGLNAHDLERHLGWTRKKPIVIKEKPDAPHTDGTPAGEHGGKAAKGAAAQADADAAKDEADAAKEAALKAAEEADAAADAEEAEAEEAEAAEDAISEDAKPGTLEAMSNEQLAALMLERGLTPDKRWGRKKLLHAAHGALQPA